MTGRRPHGPSRRWLHPRHLPLPLSALVPRCRHCRARRPRAALSMPCLAAALSPRRGLVQNQAPRRATRSRRRRWAGCEARLPRARPPRSWRGTRPWRGLLEHLPAGHAGGRDSALVSPVVRARA
eukprot:11773318-Heterocapsa_arctica.AAC.1